VPGEIIEAVTRGACAAGRIFNAGDFFKGIETEQTWRGKPPIGSICISCAKVVTEATFMASPGPLCLGCVESELKVLSNAEDFKDWPAKRILDALSPDGDIKSRLAVISRFDDALRALAAKGHDGKEDGERLSTLLVQNLGYLTHHPLAGTVRQWALRTCSRESERTRGNSTPTSSWPSG
jgi:hypothetical protein